MISECVHSRIIDMLQVDLAQVQILQIVQVLRHIVEKAIGQEWIVDRRVDNAQTANACAQTVEHTSEHFLQHRIGHRKSVKIRPHEYS